MNTHRIATCALLVCFSLAAANVSAAVMATVIVDSPTVLTVALDGALSGPTPGLFSGDISIDFGSLNFVENIDPIAVSGGYNISAAGGALFNNVNTEADTIQLFGSPFPPIAPGTLVNGQATFEYNVPHLIVPGQGFSVWWGGSDPSVNGTLQSTGTTIFVPEPASAALLLMGALGGFRRRR